MGTQTQAAPQADTGSEKKMWLEVSFGNHDFLNRSRAVQVQGDIVIGAVKAIVENGAWNGGPVRCATRAENQDAFAIMVTEQDSEIPDLTTQLRDNGIPYDLLHRTEPRPDQQKYYKGKDVVAMSSDKRPYAVAFRQLTLTCVPGKEGMKVEVTQFKTGKQVGEVKVFSSVVAFRKVKDDDRLRKCISHAGNRVLELLRKAPHVLYDDKGITVSVSFQSEDDHYLLTRRNLKPGGGRKMNALVKTASLMKVKVTNGRGLTYEEVEDFTSIPLPLAREKLKEFPGGSSVMERCENKINGRERSQSHGHRPKQNLPVKHTHRKGDAGPLANNALADGLRQNSHTSPGNGNGKGGKAE